MDIPGWLKIDGKMGSLFGDFSGEKTDDMEIKKALMVKKTIWCLRLDGLLRNWREAKFRLSPFVKGLEELSKKIPFFFFFSQTKSK